MTQPDLRSAIAEHSWLHFYQMQRLIDRPPMVITRGAGAKVYDQDGKEYIDALAGLFCVNAGYGREPIARAMYEQATKIHYVHGGCGGVATCGTLAAAHSVGRITQLRTINGAAPG